ncbi:MAG: helix-turn-helix transcriptional regulator [bacterium]|nr:helix-turn-helix transcriptional regulator [bacterium]
MGSLKDEIGKRLAAIRKDLDISQVEMSQESGVSRGYIASVESGRQTPSFDFLVKISGRFSVSLDWLISGRGQMFMIGEDHFLNSLKPEHVDFLKSFYALPVEKQEQLLNIFNEIIDTAGA